jgi:hypothetical protein
MIPPHTMIARGQCVSNVIEMTIALSAARKMNTLAAFSMSANDGNASLVLASGAW